MSISRHNCVHITIDWLLFDYILESNHSMTYWTLLLITTSINLYIYLSNSLMESLNQIFISVATWSLRLRPVCNFPPISGPINSYHENLVIKKSLSQIWNNTLSRLSFAEWISSSLALMTNFDDSHSVRIFWSPSSIELHSLSILNCYTKVLIHANEKNLF